MFWFNFNTIHLKYFDFDVRDVRIRIDTQSLFWYVNFLILILSCHIFTAVFFLASIEAIKEWFQYSYSIYSTR